MFDGLAPGAMTTVTGIVTLLTTAHLLSQLLPEYKETYISYVVLVSAQLDAAAMFDGLAPGAMTTVTGIVTLLTTAHLLSQLLPEYKETYRLGKLDLLVENRPLNIVDCFQKLVVFACPLSKQIP
ncbi:hypothetical protein J6590_007726 [Homalodisca vitripennis]|nr:hypothetical protein J6590_007726 [Homalodisca vitripennis]